MVFDNEVLFVYDFIVKINICPRSSAWIERQPPKLDVVSSNLAAGIFICIR